VVTILMRLLNSGEASRSWNRNRKRECR